MTTQQLIDDLFREGVPYAESLNSRLCQVLISMGGDSATINSLFRDYFPYSSTFNSRLRQALELVGVTAADTADLFADGKNYNLSLNSRLLYAFAHAGPSIQASNASFAESAAINDAIWTLSMANHPSGASGWTFTIDSQTPTGKLKITTSPTVLIAAQSNYDAGETGGSVTYRGTKTGQTDVTTTIAYSVTNVLEVTLGAITLSSSTASNGVSTTITLVGKQSSGSTFSIVSGALPTGMSINSSTGAITGTCSTDAAYSFTIRETHPDATTGYRDSAVSITVSSSVPQTAEIHLAWGDSLTVGVWARNTGAGDLSSLATGTYQVRERSPSGIAQTLPLDQAIAPDGTNYLSPMESVLTAAKTATGLDQYLIAHGWGGTKMIDAAGNGETWAVGGLLHEAAIVRWNAAIATIVAAEPGARVASVTSFMGTNNNGDSASAFKTHMIAAMADIMARVYMNGVSGQTLADAGVAQICTSLIPETRGTNFTVENAVREAAAVSGAKYFRLPEGETSDFIHPNLAGNRAYGARWQALRADTTAPTITMVPLRLGESSTTAGEGLPFYQYISSTEYFCPVITGGADASLFEIVAFSLGSPGNVVYSRTGYAIRSVSGGNMPAYAGNSSDIKHVQITCYDKGGNATVVNHTVTVRPQRAWTPADLPPTLRWNATTELVEYEQTLKAWYDFSDAATVSLSGSNITAVADKSGNGFTMTPSGTVTYSASGGPGSKGIAQINPGYMEASVAAKTFSDGLMFASAWQRTGAGATGFSALPMGRSLSNKPASVDGYNTNRFVGADTSFSFTTSAPDLGTDSQYASWNVLMESISFPSTHVEYVNGASSVVVAGFNYGDTATRLMMGSRADHATDIRANMGEHVASLFLGTTDRQKIDGYMKSRWGGTLPGGHPYASSAPVI